MSEQLEFMEQALNLARESVEKHEGGPFGALVVKEGKIIGRGMNGVVQNHDPTAHAEVRAIREACENLKSHQLEGCTIYSSCEPCPMCMGAIYWARPEAVYFAASREDASAAGFDDSFIYSELEKPYEQRSISVVQLNSPGAISPFTAWLEKTDKVKY